MFESRDIEWQCYDYLNLLAIEHGQKPLEEYEGADGPLRGQREDRHP
jgi:hypothetical protein